MDIAKYIGLFLLKNHFCYVHGLGNMELTKKSSVHDGKVLLSPAYEVIVTPGGSIDDNLANFIATNEQISISKAANALRDYSIQTRKELSEGKEVEIPNIGRFVEESGKVKFITNDNFRFTPAGIPTIRNSKQLEEQNAKPIHKPSYPEPHKADSINWSMVILVAVLLILLGGGAYGIWYYTIGINKQNNNRMAPAPAAVVKDTGFTSPSLTDTTRIHDSLAAPMTVPVDSTTVNTYKVIIGDYPTKERADRRVKNLQLNGTHVEMRQLDSLNYLVLATVNCRIQDTTHVKDSLERLFGYRNVMITK